MRAFNDADGRRWEIAFDDASIARFREATSIDLRAVDGGKFWSGLADEPKVFGALFWALCQPQIATRGMTGLEFGQAVAGVIEAATEAVIQASCDSMPANLQRGLRKSYKRNERLTKRNMKEVPHGRK